MIQELDATIQNTSFVLSIVKKSAGLGTGVEVNWLQKLQNKAVPWQFYIVGEQSLILVNGSDVTLCGTPADREEFISFLAFANTKRVISDGFLIDDWEQLPLHVMAYSAVSTGYLSPVEIDHSPPMQDVIELHQFPPERADYVYFTGCMRRNYNNAAIWGIYQQNRLVSTASLFSLTPTHATLSNVETLPQWQKHGYAHALIQSLCDTYAPREIDLLCENALVPFYESMNFKKTNLVYINSKPE